MFRVKLSKKEEVAVRFHRHGDETVCEIRTGKPGKPAKEMKMVGCAETHRVSTDRYDKVIGHLISLDRASNEMKSKKRREIFAAYADWAKKQGIRTSVNLNRVGI